MRLLTVCLGLIVGLSNCVTLSSSYAESLTFTTRGLDLSQVHLVVDVPHEYYERFYERTRRHLTQAGLSTKHATRYEQGEPVLRLTLEVDPLYETCPEHYLYTRKLEVEESVTTKRITKVSAWAVTWSFGESKPEVRNSQINVEEMEKDIDQLMKVFLFQYQYAN
jgi:hypothetical protein